MNDEISSAIAERNHLLREAQKALWDLEDIVMSRSEILKITGYLQGKKIFSEEYS
jgi:hypothetical protein